VPAEKEPQAGGSAAPPEEEHPLLKRGYKRWLVFVLVLVSVFNFADRAILAVLAQPIKEDLHLTDTDLGLLQGLGFAILYSVLGVPLGWLAERVSRKKLIATCVGVWSLMTIACGFATNFATLLLGRVGVGIGEAGVQPPTSSMLADHFKPNKRASVMAIIMLGAPIGFLVGQSVGGWVASEWNWRVAFFVMGLPGILVALLVWFTLREPPRGLADGSISVAEPPSIMMVVRYLVAKPTYVHLLVGSTITAFAFNAIASFVLPFYLRGFELPLAVLGVMFGVVTFTSNGLGMLLGGFGFDRLARRDPRWSLWGPAIALVLSMPLYFNAFAAREIYASLAFLWLGNFFVVTYLAPTAGTMQNLVGSRMRATTSALTAMVGGLVGAGLGPTVVGMLSDYFAERAFKGADFLSSCPGGRATGASGSAPDVACLSASTDGVRYALISVLVFFLWAAIHYVLAARHLKADLYDPTMDRPHPS
jgi:predicted MFS family arabinose efflux permease